MIKKTKKNGFSLFELLVSISIIGILTALASIAYSGTQKKARDARRIEDIKLIQTAAEQYYSLNTYNYPTSYGTGVNWSNILESYPKGPKGESYACASGFTCNATGYCVCVEMENDLNANASSSCDFSAETKTHYCAKNQQ